MDDVPWGRLPSLTTLRAFEATARLQGYSAAARALNVTPAAVAQQVRKLETDVGAALVRRDGRGLVLTEAGRQLARPLHEAFSVIVRGLEDFHQSQAARGVRVSTTDFFVNVVILPQLGDFWRQHPDIQVSFSPDGNAHPVDPDAYDVMVRGGPPGQTWEGCTAIPLFETQIILCSAPSLIKDGTGDLGSLPWIRDNSIGGTVFRNGVARVGCDPDAIQIVDPGGAKFELEAALLGYGLSISPELMVRRHLADQSLVRVDVPLDMLAVYYAIHRKAPRAPHVQMFLDWLIAVCAPLSPPG